MTEVSRRSPSARARILGWYVFLLAVALAGALFIQRSFLLGQVVEEADEALDQEIAELRQLAAGVDPQTGEPFGSDVASIFDVFLSRNVGVGGEGVMTIVDGRPYRSDVLGAHYGESLGLLSRWRDVTEPSRDQVATEEGPVRYLAVPLDVDGETRGVFVAAIGLRDRLDRVDEVIRLGALVYGSIFVIASAVAWLAAGEVLKPLRSLRDTAHTISESDLSQRIDVSGSDEIADLSTTFNNMLDRLEEAFATQQRFVDDAGHELRTPITIIRGHIELMSDDPSERGETVALVTEELDRMSRIVEDLLALAKAEQPDFVVRRPIDLAEFIEDTVAKASALTDDPVLVDRAHPAVIDGDEQRLTQAVMNLVRNAVEHTPAGTTIEVGGATSDGRALIWVTDDGPGIPESERAHIFERFGRGLGGRRTTRGAGLGLSIVKAIAEAHGGSVDLDTGPGGSTFTLSLPGPLREDTASREEETWAGS